LSRLAQHRGHVSMSVYVPLMLSLLREANPEDACFATESDAVVAQ